MTMFCASYAFGYVLFTCELFQRVTDRFDEINDIVGQLDWYRFSHGIQKILPTLLINIQQPVFVVCFGKISCSRETFKKVSF